MAQYTSLKTKKNSNGKMNHSVYLQQKGCDCEAYLFLDGTCLGRYLSHSRYYNHHCYVSLYHDFLQLEIIREKKPTTKNLTCLKGMKK